MSSLDLTKIIRTCSDCGRYRNLLELFNCAYCGKDFCNDHAYAEGYVVCKKCHKNSCSYQKCNCVK
jgi:hypothetical protein